MDWDWLVVKVFGVNRRLIDEYTFPYSISMGLSFGFNDGSGWEVSRRDGVFVKPLLRSSVTLYTNREDSGSMVTTLSLYPDFWMM